MDFKGIQYFITVADELNLTHAAEKLHMSQPPLSYEIKRLESDLGVQLFIRKPRGLQLTEEGRAYYRRATQILALADTARDELRSMGHEVAGKVNIGLVEGYSTTLAAKWIAGLKDKFPLVTYSLWNGSSDDVLDRLNKGLLDLALIAAPYDHETLDGVVVGEEPWVAMIPASNVLAQRPGREIYLKDLAGQTLIVPERKSRVEGIYRWFKKVGVTPKILCTTSSYTDAVALTKQNAGISIFPLVSQDHNKSMLVKKVITHPMKIVRYLLVWEKVQPPKGAALEVVEYVKESIKDGNIRFGFLKDEKPQQSITGSELL